MKAFSVDSDPQKFRASSSHEKSCRSKEDLNPRSLSDHVNQLTSWSSFKIICLRRRSFLSRILSSISFWIRQWQQIVTKSELVHFFSRSKKLRPIFICYFSLSSFRTSTLSPCSCYLGFILQSPSDDQDLTGDEEPYQPLPYVSSHCMFKQSLVLTSSQGGAIRLAQYLLIQLAQSSDHCHLVVHHASVYRH